MTPLPHRYRVFQTIESIRLLMRVFQLSADAAIALERRSSPLTAAEWCEVRWKVGVG